ncbi:hypothetical protein OIDMADRAFT_182816 [Oidiodendron maius Zn]|uniref:CENP-V/GFA domain-containing protein n=1 Tax=Oidiodendron maius (strain Zn) TaxID=913774 RepID=A0A0C3GN35_OIDMZ|nr:hypothetical protein OIDMADRAFT_182816 [Oidiodendron maius Zn]
MPGSGSCLCGNIAYEFTGEPAVTALCHCTECQKWGASTFSANAVVPTSAFNVTKGTPKSFPRIALVSGKPHNLFFCSDCGGHLYTQPESSPGTTNIQTGSLHDTNIPIAAELFVGRRCNYVEPLENALQVEKMP